MKIDWRRRNRQLTHSITCGFCSLTMHSHESRGTMEWTLLYISPPFTDQARRSRWWIKHYAKLKRTAAPTNKNNSECTDLMIKYLARVAACNIFNSASFLQRSCSQRWGNEIPSHATSLLLLFHAAVWVTTPPFKEIWWKK